MRFRLLHITNVNDNLIKPRGKCERTLTSMYSWLSASGFVSSDDSQQQRRAASDKTSQQHNQYERETDDKNETPNSNESGRRSHDKRQQASARVGSTDREHYLH